MASTPPFREPGRRQTTVQLRAPKRAHALARIRRALRRAACPSRQTHDPRDSRGHQRRRQRGDRASGHPQGVARARIGRDHRPRPWHLTAALTRLAPCPSTPMSRTTASAPTRRRPRPTLPLKRRSRNGLPRHHRCRTYSSCRSGTGPALASADQARARRRHSHR